MAGIVEQPHDALAEENLFALYSQACALWNELYWADLRMTADDMAEILDEIRDVGDRLEALRPAILDRAGRNPEELARLEAVCRGEIDPAPEG